MYGFAEFTPALPVLVHQAEDKAQTPFHRHGNMDGESIPITVTKLLDRRDWKSDKRAVQAVREEGQKLLKAGTWLENTVIERDDLIAKVRKDKTKAHLGQLMTICSVKFAELSEEARKRHP